MLEAPNDCDPSPGAGGAVFVSYATADRKQALAVCQALEKRGIACWIAARDVAPGANYQEAIVHALREARAMVLVFSAAANGSDEIKKELSLASRFRIPVIALRIADFEPSDAFAYELATRQWIDAFAGWDRAIDTLASRIGELGPAAPVAAVSPASSRVRGRRGLLLSAALLLLLVIAAGGWWWLRPAPANAHSMVVRLAGFQLLSPDLAPTMRAAIDTEVAAAFNADGVVGVSSAPAPPPGTAPAYALGGTIQRDGATLRVITRLSNERSGVMLWTHTFDYDGGATGEIPRHIAVDAGNVVRCGLFGISTYRKPLPDTVVQDYFKFCEGHWDPRLEDGRKALVPAQRVVAAVPDFSWGWAAVAGGYWKVALSAADPAAADAARASGRAAADRGIALDPRNSEALYIKAVLMPKGDWLGRDALFRRAVAAQRLDCGCEHHQYGWLLASVGRTAEAVDQLHQAEDMLALYLYTPLTLADALVQAGKLDEAATAFDASIRLAPDPATANRIRLYKAFGIGDAKALEDPALPLDPPLRAALIQGLRATKRNDPSAKAAAVKALRALPADRQGEPVALLLGQLGADEAAFPLAERIADEDWSGSAIFWDPRMRGLLRLPGFAAVVTRLGLIDYWKKTGSRPDVCAGASAPPFCRLI